MLADRAVTAGREPGDALVAFGGLIAVARGATARSWLVVVAFGGALALSAWAAVETGDDQEEAVEAVVRRSAIHEHEEAAEALLVTSRVLVLLLAAGALPGRVGRIARMVSAPASLVLLVLAFRVGTSGGKLVYEHGAASAYVASSGPESGPPGEHAGEAEEREHRRR